MARWQAGDIFIAFESTHAALSAQKLLGEADLAPAVIPTPRTITASCGMTLVVREGNAQRARELLEAAPGIMAQCRIYPGDLL